MTKINLLPWRDEQRKQKQQEFFIGIGVGVGITLALLIALHIQIESMKDYQTQRNQMIKTEMVALDKKIAAIKEIEDKKNKLLTKIEVIQQLQESRPQMVHLFDELAKVTPEGIYLEKFSQATNKLTLTGQADSNARVSSYMKAIEDSLWMAKPKLNVIKKGADGKVKNFVLLAEQAKGKKNEVKGAVK